MHRLSIVYVSIIINLFVQLLQIISHSLLVSFNIQTSVTVFTLFSHYTVTFYKKDTVSSSSSCRAGSTDIPDPLSPLFPIVHRLRQVFWTNIPYPHIVAESMFVLVVLLLHGHVWGSIRVHHLWVRPCFSSSVLHVWFV